MTPGHGDDFPVKVQVRYQGSRIGRKIQYQSRRLGHRMANRVIDRREQFVIDTDGQMANRTAGYDETEFVNGIGRVWHQNHVAGRRDGLSHIGEAFFRPQGRNNLTFGIELDAETAFVIGGLRPT